jgi:hypothetical protein
MRNIAKEWRAALFLIATASCRVDASGQRTCNIDADCASGICLPTGRCAAETNDGDPAGDDAAQQGDLAPDERPAGDGDTASPTDHTPPADEQGCHPNYDRVLTAAEAPFRAGLEGMFRVSADVSGFDTTGTCTGPDCAWDLVDVGGTTADVLVTTEPLAGKWFADEPAFDGATYVTVLGDFTIPWVCAQTQLAVFEKTSTALLMLGVVSELEEGDTLLVYDPPVPIIQFPAALDDTWTTETTAEGPLCGSMVDYVISQTYTSTVDRAGTLATPYGTFLDVLRVNTLAVRHWDPVYSITYAAVRTHTFVAECHTTVAVITSATESVIGYEPAPDFTDPAELRRLAPFP